MKKNEEQWLNTIGGKLRNYEEPAPAKGWQRLAEELQAEEVAPVRLLWWKRPAVRWMAAAVLLGLVCTIGWQWQRSDRQDQVVKEAADWYAELPEPKQKTLPEAPQLAMVEEVIPPEPKKVQRRADALVESVLETPQPTAIEQMEKPLPEVPATCTDTETDPNEQPSEPAEEQVKRVRKALPYTPASQSRRSPKRGWSLGMAVEGQSLLADGGGRTSGLTPAYSSDFASQTGFVHLSSTASGCIVLPSSGDLLFKEGVPYLALAQTPVVSYDHKQPVTFGLTLRKQLGAGFSIETGLTYTLLASDIHEENSNTTASQKLHYIGLPLRAAWNFYEGRRFRAYLSAGGAVEKCVQARRAGEHLSVHPLQWSLTGAVGAEYKLMPRLGLYIEPGVAHFFDDGSDVQTIRKEHPTSLSLQTGLRLSY